MTASTMPRFLIGSAPSRAPRWSTSSAFLPCLPLAAISAAIVPYVYDVTDTLRHALAGIGPFGVGIFVFFRTSTRALWPAPPAPTCRSTTTTRVINDGIYATWSSLLPILSSHSTRPLMNLRRGLVLPPPASQALWPSCHRSCVLLHRKPERRAGLRVILVLPPSSPRWFAALPSHSSFSLRSPTPGSFCSTSSYRLALPQP